MGCCWPGDDCCRVHCAQLYKELSNFADPFIFHALRPWFLNREPFEETQEYLEVKENQGTLAECIVSNHLVRLLFGYNPSTQYDYSPILFYWRSKKKRELDFVVKRGGHYMPIEVKYQTNIKNEDGFSIIDFQKGGRTTNGLLLTRDGLEQKRSYLQIPLSVFLMLV